ncbi:unnamed protein product [Onchocerca flexuosa]|uniref:Chloride channel CLIC-like protein 1 n=1 Tax=Onchocerca flexuosa TaxID=387005 RepID=A0A183I143_9BILA|nr:unnamed protein product [Onchocerca flexuosa]
MLLLVVYMNLLVLGSHGENIDLDLHIDQKNWVDPNDPFASSSFCTKNTLDQLALCQANLKKCLKVEDHAENHYVQDSTLKHIVRNFLHRMNVDIDKAKRVDRTVEIYLDADSLVILKKYLNSKDETITMREQVREIMEELIVPQHYEDRSFVKHAFDMIVSFLPLLNSVLLAPALANIAARMSRAEKSLTEKCKADNFLSTALDIVSGLFVFKRENECEQHYKDLYVDPIYEIAPLEVISEVLSNFIFTSLGVFGRHFNIFFNEFFRDSPLHFIILKAITFFFLIVVFLFWLGGYRIRTLMATVEPSGITHTMSLLQQPIDCRSNDERPKIKSLESRLAPLRINLKSNRNAVSTNIRRRSLSTSRLSMFKVPISDSGEVNC